MWLQDVHKTEFISPLTWNIPVYRLLKNNLVVYKPANAKISVCTQLFYFSLDFNNWHHSKAVPFDDGTSVNIQWS